MPLTPDRAAIAEQLADMQLPDWLAGFDLHASWWDWYTCDYCSERCHHPEH